MDFEVKIIEALQTLSNNFMDLLNKGLSFFGTELFFMAIAVVLYWCIDKRYAFRFFNVYILGVAVTNVFKLAFKRTRPFNAYPDRVNSIGAPESTYSFPSGHTASIASIATLTTVKYGKKHKSVPIVGGVLVILVMLSRMYLGQHYLSDVFCGLTLGVFCSIVFNALLSLFKDKEEWFVTVGIVIAVVLLGVLAGTKQLAVSGDILKGVGAFLAFDVGYFIEKRFVKYNVTQNAKWYKIALRLVIGLGITVAIQQCFKLFLPESIPMLYCFLRYFVMAAWAALAAPLLFRTLKI